MPNYSKNGLGMERQSDLAFSSGCRSDHASLSAVFDDRWRLTGSEAGLAEVLGAAGPTDLSGHRWVRFVRRETLRLIDAAFKAHEFASGQPLIVAGTLDSRHRGPLCVRLVLSPRLGADHAPAGFRVDVLLEDQGAGRVEPPNRDRAGFGHGHDRALQLAAQTAGMTVFEYAYATQTLHVSDHLFDILEKPRPDAPILPKLLLDLVPPDATAPTLEDAILRREPLDQEFRLCRR